MSCGDEFDGVLLGESAAARQLRSQVERIAPYFRIALIRGDDGVGKGYVARAIHALSGRADSPFVVCEAAELAEFRAEQRSPDRPSPRCLLEAAGGGTLFMRHVGTLSFGLQAALMRVLRSVEDRGVSTSQVSGMERRRFGHHAPRFLVACESDLRTLCAVGQFRPDLYAYLSPIEIAVPALRERVEDIPALAGWLLRRYAMQTGYPTKVLARETAELLQQHRWTGNLRDLEGVMTHAAAVAEGNVIESRHLRLRIEDEPRRGPDRGDVTSLRLHEVVRGHVLHVLTLCQGNKLRAAEMLGISRSTLYRMLEANSEHVEVG